jgi:hypothetical protein
MGFPSLLSQKESWMFLSGELTFVLSCAKHKAANPMKAMKKKFFLNGMAIVFSP